MKKEPLEDRRRALEENFFQKFNEKLLEKMRREQAHEESREKLATTSGIESGGVLDALLRLGIEAETTAALAIVPLVAVAWADGKLTDEERVAVMRGAESVGLSKDSYAYALLDGWLAYRPGANLFETWIDYAVALCEGFDAEQREAFKSDVLKRSRTVAETSRGFLGLGRQVSQDEQAVLDRIEAAL